MNLLGLLLFFMLGTQAALAGLDQTRKNAFDKASQRYSNNSTNTSTQPDSSGQSTIKQNAKLKTFNESIEFTESFFINTKKISESESLNLSNSRESFLNTNSFEINYGKRLQQSGTYKKLTEVPGDYIFIESSFNASSETARNDFLTADHKYVSEKGDTKITYIGSIFHFAEDTDDSGGSFTSIDSTLSILKTTDFDPCLLKRNAELTLDYERQKFFTQGKYDISVNCMIFKNLQGDITASFVFTNQQGELLKKVDLQGSLILTVSKALLIKYTSEYIDGTNPLDHLQTQIIEDGNTGERLFIEPEPFTRVGDDFFFFKRDRRDEGKLNTLTFQHHSDPKKRCVNNKSLSIGKFDGPKRNEYTYTADFSKRCKKDSGHEKSTYTNVNISNQNENFSNSSVPILQIEHSSTKGLKSTSLEFKAAEVPASFFRPANEVAEFKITSREIKENGNRGINALKVIYTKNESYVVAEQVIILPLFFPADHLAFQKPQISPAGLEKAKEFYRKLGKELTEEEITKLLTVRADLKDQKLCRDRRCLELGFGITFTNEGGSFVTTRGKTIAEVFGRNFEIEVTAGISLNNKGVNESWGQNIGSSRFTSFGVSRLTPGRNFQLDNSQSFYQIKLKSRNCNPLERTCSSFEFRQEEDNSKIKFGWIKYY